MTNDQEPLAELCKRLRKMESKATPGPWWAELSRPEEEWRPGEVPLPVCEGYWHFASVLCAERFWKDGSDDNYVATELREDGDAALIVALRNALPRLLDELSRLSSENAALRELLARCVPDLKENLDAVGGCDHAVGICVCEAQHLLEDVIRFLEKTQTAPARSEE